jgi:hypothetical protein
MNTDMMSSKIKNIFRLVQPLFNTQRWKVKNSLNQVVFYNTNEAYDEYVIAVDYKYNSLNVSVPIETISYRQTFFNVTDVIDYVKMHLECYERKILK